MREKTGGREALPCLSLPAGEQHSSFTSWKGGGIQGLKAPQSGRSEAPKPTPKLRYAQKFMLFRHSEVGAGGRAGERKKW